MQPDTARQPGVDRGSGDVQPAAGRGRQALRQPAYRCLVAEGDGGPGQPTAPVDPHLARPVDEHVADLGIGQQRLQDAEAGQLGAHLGDQGQHSRAAQHSALVPQR